MLCLLALVVVILRYRGEHAEYSTCNTHLAEGCDSFTVAGCPYMEVAKEVFEIKRRSTLHSAPSPYMLLAIYSLAGQTLTHYPPSLGPRPFPRMRKNLKRGRRKGKIHVTGIGNPNFVYSANVCVTSSPRYHARCLFHTLVVARIDRQSAHI